MDQMRKEDVIKRVISTYPEDEVKKFIAYLFDPSVQEEISYQEKQRYNDMMDQLQKVLHSAYKHEHEHASTQARKTQNTHNKNITQLTHTKIIVKKNQCNANKTPTHRHNDTTTQRHNDTTKQQNNKTTKQQNNRASKTRSALPWGR